MRLKEGSPVLPAYRGQVPVVVETFLDSIYHRVALQGRNLIFLFLGDNGTGKSWGAINFGRLFDPFFDPNYKVIYEPAEFFDALDRIRYRGEVIVWDEAGVGMNAREWNSLFNRVVSKTLQIFREATPGRIILIFATPRKIFVDKTARVMLNMEWRFEWPKKSPHPVAKPYWLKYVVHYKSKTMEDYIVYRLPVVRVGNLEVKIRELIMGRIPDDIAEVYRKRSVPKKFQLRFQYNIIRATGDQLSSDLSGWLYEVLMEYNPERIYEEVLLNTNALRTATNYFDLFMAMLDNVVKYKKNLDNMSFYNEFRETVYNMPPAVRERLARQVFKWVENVVYKMNEQAVVGVV